jgi:predicted TIM-barrel fold metal-dependent hydrolase
MTPAPLYDPPPLDYRYLADYIDEGGEKMNGVDRRSFMKTLGQSAVALGIGLSAKPALAGLGTQKKSGGKTRKIAVEEHIGWDEYNDYVSSVGGAPLPPGTATMPGGGGPMSTLPDGTQVSTDVLGDVSGIETRLKVMDQVGIDMQVLSLRNPGVEEFETAEGIRWAKKINNMLAEVVNKYPTRFSAFATIPWQEPEAAATELERAVKDLGLRGVKMDGTVKGEYLDSKRFRPVFKKAEALNVPIFIHVEDTRESMINYYSEFSSSQATTGVGRDFDVCMHACRLISSGLFDEMPGLNFIMGHMGAGLAFWPGRITGGSLKKKPEEYIKNNFYATTSGNFYLPALMCWHYATGADRILFGVDFPTEPNQEAIDLVESAPISDEDKEKIFYRNAEKLFGV